MRRVPLVYAATFAASLLASVAWATGEVISVNIIGGATSYAGKRISEGKSAGAVSVDAAFWNQIAEKSETQNVDVTVENLGQYASGLSAPEATTASVRVQAANAYVAKTSSQTNGNAEMTYGYLDDGQHSTTGYGAVATVSNIPYALYDVYVYIGSDGDGTIGAVEVNGTWYPSKATSWGSRATARQAEVTLEENTNYIKVANLSLPTLTIRGAKSGDPANTRTGIAGFQIVKREAENYEATATGDVAFSALNWGEDVSLTGGANVVATVNLPDGATLTLDQAVPQMAGLWLVSPGTVHLAVSGEGMTLDTALAQVAQLDLSGLSELDLGTLSCSALTVPPGVTLTVAQASQVTTLTRQAGSTLKVTGDISGTRDEVLLLQDNTTLETTGNVTISDSVNETLKGRSWTLSGGTSTIAGGLYTRTGTDWQNSGAKSLFTMKAGAKLTVNAENATISASDSETAVLFATSGGAGAEILITGAGTQLAVPNGAVSVSRDGIATVTVSDGATLSAYKLGNKNQPESTMVVDGATLALGKAGATDGELSWGKGTLTLKNQAVLTANGNWAVGSASGEGLIKVAGPVAVQPAGHTITLQKIDYTGGSLAISGTGTLDLGTARPTLSAASGATVKVALTAEEIARAQVDFPAAAGATESDFAKDSFQVWDGTTAVSVTSASLTDGVWRLVLPVTTPSMMATGSWGTASAWSTGAVPTSGKVILYGGATEADAITVTLDTAIPAEITSIVVCGYVKVETSANQTLLPVALQPASGAVLMASAGFAGNYTLPAGGTVVLTGVTSGNKLTVHGTLKTAGTTELSAANEVAASGTVEVLSGETTFGLGGKTLSGTLKVDAGAIFKNGTADGPNYDGTPKFDIAGTLVVTGSTRWSIPSRSSFILRDGAVVQGAGDDMGYAFDFFGVNAKTITTYGNVRIEAPIGANAGNGTLTFACNPGETDTTHKTLTIKGALKSLPYVKGGDAGTVLQLEGANATTAGLTVNAGTLVFTGAGTLPPACALTLAENTTLELRPTTQAIELGSAITANGAISAFKEGDSTYGSILSGTISGNGAVTVGAGASLKLTGSLANKRGSTTNNGTLEVAVPENTDYSWQKISGSGTFVKSGLGTLSFTENDALGGDISVDAGTLIWIHGSADKTFGNAVNVERGATFATQAQYKNYTILSGKLSGAGTVRAKVPTYTNQSDGTRFVHVAGQSETFTGTLVAEVEVVESGASRRTNLIVKPSDGKFGGSIALKKVNSDGSDAADDTTLQETQRAYARVYLAGTCELGGTIADIFQVYVGKTNDRDNQVASVADSAVTLKAPGDYGCAIDVDAGASLTLAPTAAAKLTGLLSGDGAVALGASAAVTYAPASTTATTLASAVTLNADSTLTLAPAAALTLGGTLSGAGKLVVGDGETGSHVTLVKGTHGATTVKAASTLRIEAADAETNPLAEYHTVAVEANGVVELARGLTYCSVTGEGTARTTGEDFIFGVGTGPSNVKNTLTSKLDVPADTFFRIRDWRADGGVAPSALSLYGTIKEDGYTGTPSPSWPKVCIAGTLTGTGTFDGTATRKVNLDFGNGATIVAASSGAPSVSGTVTYGSALTVVLPAGSDLTTDGVVVLEKANIELPTAASFALTVKIGETAVTAPVELRSTSTGLLVAKKTPVTIPEVNGVSLSAASQAILQAAAETLGMDTVSTVVGTTTKDGQAATLTAAEIDAALATFTGIVSAEGETLKVAYHFGIVSVEPYYRSTGEIAHVTVKVKVQGAAGAEATCAEGVSLALVDETGATLPGYTMSNSPTATEPAFDEVENETGAYESDYLLETLRAAKNFKVKATKTETSAN